MAGPSVCGVLAPASVCGVTGAKSVYGVNVLAWVACTTANSTVSTNGSLSSGTITASGGYGGIRSTSTVVGVRANANFSAFVITMGVFDSTEIGSYSPESNNAAMQTLTNSWWVQISNNVYAYYRGTLKATVAYSSSDLVQVQKESTLIKLYVNGVLKYTWDALCNTTIYGYFNLRGGDGNSFSNAKWKIA